MSPENKSLKKVLQGALRFQDKYFHESKTLFKQLAKTQKPKVVFITCSDSRINPNLITNTIPGELFIIRNAGNLIPQSSSDNSGERASLEYAINVLNVEHVIVCGHSNCGAMSALIQPELPDGLPSVKKWLSVNANDLREEILASNLPENEALPLCIEKNIRKQMANLKQIPIIKERLKAKTISVHGWVYHIEHGDIDCYDADSDSFKNIQEVYDKLG